MSLGAKLQRFLRSPQGRRAVEKAKRELAKPENRHRIEGLIARLSRKRRY